MLGRFAGTNKSRIADSVVARSLLPLAVDEAMAFARRHLMIASIIEAIRRREQWSRPLVAFREAVVNEFAYAE